MSWKEYEKQVHEYILSQFHGKGIKVIFNHQIMGRNSGIPRQIDVYIEIQTVDILTIILVECKNWNSKLDIGDIDKFIGTLADVKASRGIMFSKLGYSAASYNTASTHDDLQLITLDFEKIKNSQSIFLAIPYRGNCGALAFPPNGWIVDASVPESKLSNMLCCFYPMGNTMEKSKESKNFIYLNIIRNIYGGGIIQQFNYQNDFVKKYDNDAKIEIATENIILANNTETELFIRKILYSEKSLNYIEYTYGIQSDMFIFYIVGICNTINQDRIKLKMKNIVNKIKFIVFSDVDPLDSHEAWRKFVNIKGLNKKP